MPASMAENNWLFTTPWYPKSQSRALVENRERQVESCKFLTKFGAPMFARRIRTTQNKFTVVKKNSFSTSPCSWIRKKLFSMAHYGLPSLEWRTCELLPNVQDGRPPLVLDIPRINVCCSVLPGVGTLRRRPKDPSNDFTFLPSE